MSIQILWGEVKDISKEILMDNGKLKLLQDFNKYTPEELRLFCHQYARYGLPTVELIKTLLDLINNRSCIEIGAGHGDIGYHLKIHMTDSKIQQTDEVKSIYKLMGQPIIQYPEDVEKIEALSAVKKYQPKVVIGSWITPYSPKKVLHGSSPYGVMDNEILSLVETYIMIGNIDTHGDNPLMQLPHGEIAAPWLRSRAKNQDRNRIFIWHKE